MFASSTLTWFSLPPHSAVPLIETTLRRLTFKPTILLSITSSSDNLLRSLPLRSEFQVRSSADFTSTSTSEPQSIAVKSRQRTVDLLFPFCNTTILLDPRHSLFPTTIDPPEATGVHCHTRRGRKITIGSLTLRDTAQIFQTIKRTSGHVTYFSAPGDRLVPLSRFQRHSLSYNERANLSIMLQLPQHFKPEHLEKFI